MMTNRSLVPEEAGSVIGPLFSRRLPTCGFTSTVGPSPRLMGLTNYINLGQELPDYASGCRKADDFEASLAIDGKGCSWPSSRLATLATRL